MKRVFPHSEPQGLCICFSTRRPYRERRKPLAGTHSATARAVSCDKKLADYQVVIIWRGIFYSRLSWYVDCGKIVESYFSCI